MFTVFNSSPPPNRPHHALGGLATHAELRVYKRHSVPNQASAHRHAGSVDLHIMSGRSVQIMQTQKQLTIGETSALCAVSVRMLRHWESMGLLHPTRDSNGYRLYSEDDIARIRRIRLYRDLGLTTDQIRAALDGPATETLSLMREQRTRISEHITQLQLILQDIDELSAYAHNTKEDETMDNPYAN